MVKEHTAFIDLLQAPTGHAGSPQVLDELRRVVASGAVPPGSAIPMDEVADFFQLSRIPVREALKTLVGEGLLEHQPRLGYTVTDLSHEELNELYLVRTALERVAVEVAMRHADSGDDQRLAGIHRASATAIAAGDPVAYQRASRDFHEAMLRPCRMPRLLHMLSIAWNVTEPVQTMVRVTDADRHSMHEEHGALLAAYRDRDAERLLSILAEHHGHVMRSVTALGD